MSAEVGENAIDIALKVASAFTSVGAEYFLGGSLASSLQGEPRATNDIDFVVALPAGRIHAFRDALGTDFDVVHEEGLEPPRLAAPEPKARRNAHEAASTRNVVR
jgi:hypothetical protein